MTASDAAPAATAPAAPPVPRAGGPLGALMISEVVRVSHRWLYRILAIGALALIVIASVIAFMFHAKTTGPAGLYGGGKPPYVARDLFAPVGLSVMIGMAVLGFIMGASVGGADWSSRSMALQLLWEPRRLRLLLSKWFGVLVAVLVLTVVAWLLALGLSALTASMRGSWEGMDGQAWHDVWDFSARGLVLVVIAVSLGYALALLVRNTGASLGVAFVYFAVFENVVSMVLAKFDVFRVLFMPNVGAWVTPGGLDFPSGRQDASGGYLQVHISSVQGLSILMLYVLVLGGAAIWSFTRRDVQ
jgi:hypothetical protein